MRSIVLCVVCILAGCATAPHRTEEAPEPPRAAREGPTPKGQFDLEALAGYLTGNWESVPRDPPMVMRVAEIWKGGPVRWFYFEWARPGERRPVRQRILRIAEDGEPGVMTAVFHRLPGDELAYAGEWEKPQPFASVKPEQLRSIGGCRMRVVRTMIGHFTLVTEGPRCPGDLPGVPYMRFEFSLTSSDLNLLEQPRDAQGKVPEDSRLEPFAFRRMGTQPSWVLPR